MRDRETCCHYSLVTFLWAHFDKPHSCPQWFSGWRAGANRNITIRVGTALASAIGG